MDTLSNAEKAIVNTIASYSVMSELESNSIINKATWEKHYDSLNDIQKRVISLYEVEKTNLFTKIMGKMG